MAKHGGLVTCYKQGTITCGDHHLTGHHLPGLKPRLGSATRRPAGVIPRVVIEARADGTKEWSSKNDDLQPFDDRSVLPSDHILIERRRLLVQPLSGPRGRGPSSLLRQ